MTHTTPTRELNGYGTRVRCTAEAAIGELLVGETVVWSFEAPAHHVASAAAAVCHRANAITALRRSGGRWW